MMVSDHGWSVASSSPERLILVDDGTVSTRPIKGTRKRGADDASDDELRHDLASSPKEMAEHLMLVDLERHDLSRICVNGSVHWSDWRIEALSNVQHLVSGIQGELSESFTAGRAVAEMFPGGSVTGCPKTVTLAAIDELEGSPRGAWTGSMGHVHSGAGIADWNILIRTLEAHSGPHSWHGTVQAGGGIVIGSSPAEEVEEARWKAAAVTESAWGFRTGFSDTDLPAREVAIIPFPMVSGPISKLSPGKHDFPGRVGLIHREAKDAPEGSIILVDNLDSFTENIAQSLAILGSEVLVVEGRPEVEGNPSETLNYWLEKVRPSRIVLGPGPARPEASEITMEIARRAISGKLLVDSRAIPVLGLCLGHQALGLAAGWRLNKSPLGAVHGIPSSIINDGSGLYSGMGEKLVMMRYNSLVLEESNDYLIPNSWDETGSLLMGLRHGSLPIHGIQFHPESVGSPRGMEILSAFLEVKPVEQHHENEPRSSRPQR
jgi:anthranilate synthase/aminodeoxychorismate synthase-like glutamine amidotransferase